MKTNITIEDIRNITKKEEVKQLTNQMRQNISPDTLPKLEKIIKINNALNRFVLFKNIKPNVVNNKHFYITFSDTNNEEIKHQIVLNDDTILYEVSKFLKASFTYYECQSKNAIIIINLLSDRFNASPKLTNKLTIDVLYFDGQNYTLSDIEHLNIPYQMVKNRYLSIQFNKNGFIDINA